MFHLRNAGPEMPRWGQISSNSWDVDWSQNSQRDPKSTKEISLSVFVVFTLFDVITSLDGIKWWHANWTTIRSPSEPSHQRGENELKTRGIEARHHLTTRAAPSRGMAMHGSCGEQHPEASDVQGLTVASKF